jgi:hypothetical protein
VDADQVDFFGDADGVAPVAREIAAAMNAEFIRLG